MAAVLPSEEAPTYNKIMNMTLLFFKSQP